jgi:hypothetical protein
LEPAAGRAGRRPRPAPRWPESFEFAWVSPPTGVGPRPLRNAPSAVLSRERDDGTTFAIGDRGDGIVVPLSAPAREQGAARPPEAARAGRRAAPLAFLRPASLTSVASGCSPGQGIPLSRRIPRE